MRHVCQRSPDHFLGVPEAVHGGRINPVQTDVDRVPYRRDRIGIVLMPPAEPPVAADSPSAEADRCEIECGLAELLAEIAFDWQHPLRISSALCVIAVCSFNRSPAVYVILTSSEILTARFSSMLLRAAMPVRHDMAPARESGTFMCSGAGT